jgi:aerobic carbon-monoxide dehydrogenase medium subunit
MKPAPFEYHAPETIADAVALVGAHGDEAKALAGGQSLVPMLALRLTRFEHIIDLNGVGELAGITRENGVVAIGAMTRQRAVELDPDVAAAVPLLARAAPHIGHFQIRNRGTVGGSIAHADPASEIPAVALALDAEMVVAGASGNRTVPAADFFVGTWTTSVADDELLVQARLPVWDGRCGFAFEEVARRLGDFALAGVACAVSVSKGGAVERAAISFLGMGPTPARAPAAEAALIGSDPAASDLAEIAQLAVRDLDPSDDVHASGRYRKRVGAHLVERTLASALEEARAT